MRIVSLSSGGIDSSVMMHVLLKRGYDVLPLFVDYGQLARHQEWSACQRVCEFLNLQPRKIDISGYGELVTSGITDSSLDIVRDAFLPNRNLLLLLIAASYGFQNGAYVVAIGLLSTTIFEDQTRKFVGIAEEALKESLGADVRVMAPMISFNKYDVLRLGIKHEFPIDLAYYCHSGRSSPCGKCISCKEYIAAMEYLNSTNPY